jgi:hypothetical protein
MSGPLAHERLTVLAGVVALVVVLRRWRIPTAAIVVWVGLAAVCLWPLTIAVIVLELRRFTRGTGR